MEYRNNITCGTFGHILGGHNILGAGTMLEMTLQYHASYRSSRFIRFYELIWDNEHAMPILISHWSH